MRTDTRKLIVASRNLANEPCAQQTLRSAHTVHLRVVCVSQNQQRLSHRNALTDWFLYARRGVFTARYEWNL
jgi:hypothetical protein